MYDHELIEPVEIERDDTELPYTYVPPPRKDHLYGSSHALPYTRSFEPNVSAHQMAERSVTERCCY